MLSRSAEGLYWIGRYLERGQHSCRLIADQFETIKDRPVNQIDKGWQRLFQGLHRVPFGSRPNSNMDDEQFMLVDAYTLADDLTFEPSNPNSIRNSLANARENARQVRNVVDEDLWACLNLAFLDLRDMDITDIWKDRPNEFYRRTEDSVRTFFGIAESNMYRDDGWYFLQLGRFIERAQLIVGLINAQFAVYSVNDSETGLDTNSGGDTDWLSLLRICAARDSYRRLHSLYYEHGALLNFLVADPQLSRSIRYASAQICQALEAVSGGRPLVVEAGRRAGRLAALIDYDWPNLNPADNDAILAILNEIGDSCRRLHDDIDVAYFNYAIGEGIDG